MIELATISHPLNNYYCSEIDPDWSLGCSESACFAISYGKQYDNYRQNHQLFCHGRVLLQLSQFQIEDSMNFQENCATSTWQKAPSYLHRLYWSHDSCPLTTRDVQSWHDSPEDYIFGDQPYSSLFVIINNSAFPRLNSSHFQFFAELETHHSNVDLRIGVRSASIFHCLE